MSKTLTEQYYDLELEEGFYYAKSEMGNVFILEINPCWTKMYSKCEILGKVPDYYQFTKLGKTVKQLKENNKRWQDFCEFGRKGNLSNLTTIHELLDEKTELSIKVLQLQKKLDIAVGALNIIDKIATRIDLSGLRYEDRRRINSIIFECGIIDDALKKIKDIK